MIILSVLFIIIIFLLSILYLHYKLNFRYWKKVGIKHADPSIPWGNFNGVGQPNGSFGECLTKIYKQYPNERYIGIWLFSRPALLVRDPELIKDIFVRDFMSFHDRGVDINERDDPLAAHLFSIGGTKWRNLRVKLSPTFTSGKMKMMFPIFIECSKQLTSVLNELAEKEQVIDMKEYCARFTTDVISQSAFGLEIDCMHNPDNDFRHYGKKMLDPSLIQFCRNLSIALFPKIAIFLRITNTPSDVAEFFLSALKNNINYRKDNNIRRNDFLDLLIQLMEKGTVEDVDNNEKRKTEQTFTFEEAAAQAFVFFLAGFETSSTTMQFCLYELALHPDIQEKVRQDIKSILQKYNGEITYDSIGEMHYLTRVVDETLRKYPAVPLLQRECNKDYNIPGTDIILTKKNIVFIDVLGLHRDSNYYKDPDQFDPDRFTEENKASRHHYSYLPFGEGPRNCIGMRFGLMQAKAGLAAMLKDYVFSVAENTPIPIKYDPKSFIMSPVGGMHLKISKIDK